MRGKDAYPRRGKEERGELKGKTLIHFCHSKEKKGEAFCKERGAEVLPPAQKGDFRRKSQKGKAALLLFGRGSFFSGRVGVCVGFSRGREGEKNVNRGGESSTPSTIKRKGRAIIIRRKKIRRKEKVF